MVTPVATPPIVSSTIAVVKAMPAFGLGDKRSRAFARRVRWQQNSRRTSELYYSGVGFTTKGIAVCGGRTEERDVGGERDAAKGRRYEPEDEGKAAGDGNGERDETQRV